MAELDLDTLESKGLIRVATIQPELEYLFRHALVQDAAYDSLLKQERRALHRQVGAALEQLYPERHGELAAVLARHFEQAGEPEKALEYLLEAARFAWDRNAILEAHELYGRASALMPPPTPDDDAELRHRRLEIDFGRLKSGFSFLEQGLAESMIAPLMEQADQTDDLRLAADVYLHIALLQSYRNSHGDSNPELRRSLDRVAEIARQLDDPLIDALPKSLIGLFQVFAGNLKDGVETLSAVAPMLGQKRDFVGSSFALVALAIGLARLGRFDEAQQAADRASAVAEDGDVIARLDALIGQSVVASVRGNLDQAVTIGRQCSEMAQSTGAAACLVSSSFFLGDAYMRNGQYGEARIVFERGNSVADMTNFAIFRPSISAYLRSTMASLGGGAPVGTTLTFDEGIAEAQATGDRWGETNVIWKRAETQWRQGGGNFAQVNADYATAVAAFEDMGALPFQARALRDWGMALRATGEVAEGDVKLRSALVLMDELGLEREAAEIRELLASSSG
jgi:tetratricopeptide (TPR) repeat protein